MADLGNDKPLTNEEVGFFSEIEESPSLYLSPGTVRIIGIIGTGKATKTVEEDATRGSGKSDAFANGISSVNVASSNSIFLYPRSSYAIAHVGSSFSVTGLDGKTFKVTVDGQTEESVTLATPADLAAVVSQINAAMSKVDAEASGTNLRIWVTGTGCDGLSFTIGAGTGNTLLGFTASDRAKSIRWDPAVTDSNFAPQATETYTLNYERPKAAADFAPQSFFGLPAVIAEYGEPSAKTDISLGAKGAYRNGASIIICRQLDPAQMDTGPHKKSEMVTALADMELQDISLLVPMLAMNDDSTVLLEYLVHVSKMSSKLERKERRVFLGMDEIAANIAILGTAPSWQASMLTVQPGSTSGLASQRVEVMGPGYGTTTYKGTTLNVNGCFFAACAAGLKVNPAYDEAESMTKKVISDIDAIRLPERSRPEKNALTRLGVSWIDLKGATTVIRRSVSADDSSIGKQEPSIVDAFDRVAVHLRDGLENRFEGTKTLSLTSTAVEAAAKRFLDIEVDNQIIGGYKPDSVTATRNKTEPRQFDIRAEATPVFPFLWGSIKIYITVG